MNPEEQLDQFEQDLGGKRLLIISVDQQTGDTDCDYSSFMGWEVVGLGEWLNVLGHELMAGDDIESGTEED